MFQDWSARERRHGRNDVPQLCEDAADELAALRAERDQFKAMWERDSTALGKALAQRDTARVDAEDKRARVAELEADAARFAWVLPIVSGDDDATADAHAMALALHLGRNLTGRAAIDAAMRDAGNKPAQQKGDV